MFVLIKSLVNLLSRKIVEPLNKLSKMQIRSILFIGALVWSSLSHAQVKTPAPSPMGKIEQKVGLTDVAIEYSRPSMKNRLIFGDLVPFEEMWRTGANASTKITFSEDVMIDGKNLEKGTYALYTIPGEVEWTFAFYKDITHWGVPKEYKQTEEALRIVADSEEIPWTVETFTIDVNNLRDHGARINLMWESTIVGFDFSVNTDEMVQATIDKTLAGPSRGDYFSAARYYYTNEKDLDKALEWAKMSNEIDAKFWQLRLQSLIEAKLGDTESAIETAKRSMEMAEEAGNANYVRMNKASIAEWMSDEEEEEEEEEMGDDQ